MDFEQQLKFLDLLDAHISHKAKSIIVNSIKDIYQSIEIAALIGSLAKAQGEYPKIVFNRKASYFEEEYADFDTIMSVIRPILCIHGLAVVQQQRIHDSGVTMLHTILTHESGQWMESRARII